VPEKKTLAGGGREKETPVSPQGGGEKVCQEPPIALGMGVVEPNASERGDVEGKRKKTTTSDYERILGNSAARRVRPNNKKNREGGPVEEKRGERGHPSGPWLETTIPRCHPSLRGSR